MKQPRKSLCRILSPDATKLNSGKLAVNSNLHPLIKLSLCPDYYVNKRSGPQTDGWMMGRISGCQAALPCSQKPKPVTQSSRFPCWLRVCLTPIGNSQGPSDARPANRQRNKGSLEACFSRKGERTSASLCTSSHSPQAPTISPKPK